MSLRLLVILVLAGIIAAGVGATFWVTSQPAPAPETPSAAPVTDGEQRAHRERFFGGDPDRDVRGGQEMKPRW